MIRIFSVFVFLFFLTGISTGQQEVAAWFLKDLHQSQLLNPAWGAGQQGLAISLPGLFYSTNLPLEPGQLVQKNDADQTVFDIDALLNASEEEDEIISHAQINTLGAGWSLAGFRFSAWHSFKAAQQLLYSKDLIRLGWEGNAAFVGQEVAFGPDLQLTSWSEFGLGISRRLGPVSVGFSAKFLNGIGDVSTPSSLASLYTDDDIYQLRLTTDYRINSSSFLRINEADQLEIASDPLSAIGALSGNTGWAFDIGAIVHVSEKLMLSASIIDIGTVRWDQDVENYLSSGTFSFDGLEFDNIFNRDSLNFQEVIDTLDQIFEFSERSEHYTTAIPARLYAGATFQINESWQFGAVYHSESFRDKRYHAIGVSAFYNAFPWLGLGGSWITRYGRTDQIGFQILVQTGPLQIYALTDNMLALLNADQRAVGNARIGFNLLF